jgi:hypothetical protein
LSENSAIAAIATTTTPVIHFYSTVYVGGRSGGSRINDPRNIRDGNNNNNNNNVKFNYFDTLTHSDTFGSGVLRTSDYTLNSDTLGKRDSFSSDTFGKSDSFVGDALGKSDSSVSSRGGSDRSNLHINITEDGLNGESRSLGRKTLSDVYLTPVEESDVFFDCDDNESRVRSYSFSDWLCNTRPRSPKSVYASSPSTPFSPSLSTPITPASPSSPTPSSSRPLSPTKTPTYSHESSYASVTSSPSYPLISSPRPLACTSSSPIALPVSSSSSSLTSLSSSNGVAHSLPTSRSFSQLNFNFWLREID